MPANQINVDNLSLFLKEAGRNGENLEAWMHALLDLIESYNKINCLLLEGVNNKATKKNCTELLCDIREELRHIHYHIEDIDGK